MPPPGPWHIPGITERLMALHAEGITMREVAERLNCEFETGLTRNAVIGKCRRLCMPFRDPPVRVRKPRIYKYRPRVKPKPPRVEPNGTVTIYQLRSDDCRFPLGDFPFVFCGKEQQDGSSYCPEHFRICHGIVQRKDDSAVQMKAWA